MRVRHSVQVRHSMHIRWHSIRSSQFTHLEMVILVLENAATPCSLFILPAQFQCDGFALLILGTHFQVPVALQGSKLLTFIYAVSP